MNGKMNDASNTDRVFDINDGSERDVRYSMSFE